jgi:Flp pilus assembly protein TadG
LIDLRRAAASERGAVALEFALIAPVFLLLVLGTMVFAIYFATVVAVVHGSAEGARASVAGLDATERTNLAKARVTDIFTGYQPLLDPAKATTDAGAGTQAGTFKVKVSYPLAGFNFGGFYSLMNFVTGGSATQPTTVSNTVTVANGGY